MLGILGGMGPLATVDFLAKLVAATPSARDQDHVPVLAYSVPQIPERVPAILGRGPSPLPAMLEGVGVLVRGGARAIAIPCHTAHHWYDALAAAAQVPVLHIADAAIAELGAARRVGLVATAGTIASGFYQRRLAASGRECLLPEASQLRESIAEGIGLVKAGQAAQARAPFLAVVEALAAAGAERVLLACTEVPVGLAAAGAALPPSALDPTDALARACVRWWRARALDTRTGCS